MGNEILRPNDLEPFAGFNDNQQSYLQEKFDCLCDQSKLLNVDKMVEILCTSKEESIKILNYIDFEGHGQVDFYEFTCAAASLHQNDDESLQFLFDIYANGKQMDQNSFYALYGTIFRSLKFHNIITENYTQEVGQKKFKKYDFNGNGSIGFDQFQAMLKNDYHCRQWMEKLGFAARARKEIDEKPINQEIDTGGEFLLEEAAGDQAGSTPSWIKTAEYMAPEGFDKYDTDNPPSTNLDINYVYGYRSYDTRDNLRYSSNGQVVYHTGGMGIVLNKTKNTMRVTTAHNDDVTCLDINVNKNLVATGQMGRKPSLVIWDPNTLQTKAIFRNNLEKSIATVAISKSGQYVAATSMSDYHQIAIYNIQNNSLVAFGRGPRSVIYNIKFNNAQDEVVCACAQEVTFAKFSLGKIQLKKGIFGKAPLKPNLCVAALGDAMITSMNNGLLAYWKGNFCSKVFKQHTKPVGALCQRSEGGIISGDTTGKIVIWSMNMSKQRELNLEKLLNTIKSNDIRIISLCEQANNILVGTRGGQIIEVNKGQSANILMEGHYDGQLWGLAMQSKNQFITGGQDKLLIKWDMTKRKQVSKRKLDHPINSLDISRHNLVAVGQRNGIVSFYDGNTFNHIRKISNFKNPDKDMLSLVKFSPDGNTLAVGYCPPISKVYLYNVDSGKKIGQCQGSPSRIVCIDFSKDSSFIMINNTSYQILFYKSTNGQQMTSATYFKKEEWATMTCRFAWHSQGIWPPYADGSDINAVDRSNSKKYLVTGDDSSKVKLFRYPVYKKRQIYNLYKGHSSHVTNIKWSADDHFIVSTGGLEKSIIQWVADEQRDEAINYDFDEEQVLKPESKMMKMEEEEDQYEYQAEGGQSPRKGDEEIEEGDWGVDADEGDQALAIKPFLGQVKASTPLEYKVNTKANTMPEADMDIHHVWGIRNQYISDRVRNQLKYSADSESCFFITAALGVQMNFKDKSQTFYRGHQEDLVSFSITKDRKLCATGQMAQLNLKNPKDKIVDVHVWDAQTKQQLAKLSRFHQRAVVIVEFSPTGKRLLTIGQDDKNSLAVYDWEINRIAWSSPVCNAKVTGAVWKNETEYMTVGLKHVKFWSSGKGRMGKLSTNKWDPMVSALYYNDKFISGGSSGSVYLWSGNMGNPTKGHSGRVDCLAVDLKDKIYSGCSKGVIMQWKYSGGKLIADRKIIDMSSLDSFDPGILSLDFSKEQMLVCTNSSSIYQIPIENANAQSTQTVMQSHFMDQLWGGAWAPNCKNFVTGGDDRTIRIYDIITYQMKYSYQMKERVRGVDWEQKEGKLIVVGDYKGRIYLFDNELNLLSEVKTKFSKTRPRKQPYWIEDIKFSPNGQYVAFGAHGGASHLQIYQVKDNKIEGPPKIINGLITSALLSVDWSQSSDMLAIVSQAYELQFTSLDSRINASSVRNVKWATWSGKFGFCVQQIHQDVDYSNINAVCMSPSRSLIVTGGDDQKVRLFNYPVTIPKQKNKAFVGHSSHVTRVRFSRNQQFLLSEGGNDRTIIIWRMKGNEPPPEEQVEQIQEQQENQKGQEGDQGDEQGDWGDAEAIMVPKPREQKVEQKKQELDDFALDQDQGDQFMAVKPWLGAIKQPTEPYYKGNGKAPSVTLQLDYAHGYRVKDCRNNLKYLNSSQVCYHTAGVGVIMRIDKHPKQQRFFNNHTDDIISMAWSQNREMMFTGEMGAKPLIYQWDQSGTQIQSYRGVKKGVSAIGVNEKYVVAAGLDDNHYVYVFDRDQGKLISSEKGGRDVIIDLKFVDKDTFVSIGMKHYKEWNISESSIKGKNGSFGKNCNILCSCVVTGGKVYAGASDGSLQLWISGSCSKSIKVHSGAIHALCIHKDKLLTGSSDETIKILDLDSLSVINTLDCKQILNSSINKSIRALDVFENNILVGTLGSEIFEVKSNEAISNSTENGKFRLTGNHMNGHYAPNYVTNQVWGLALLDQKTFATCSDDGTMRIWDINKKEQLGVASLKFDSRLKPIVSKPKEKFLPDEVKGRCLAISPEKSTVIGCKDGTVKIVNAQLKPLSSKRISQKQISHIKFSPDGTMLAIGAHDCTIYLFDWESGKMKLRSKSKKHSSYIKHFDFSRDGNFLHSTCGAYQLLFWDTNTGKQVTSGATATRNEQWHTWNVTLGWPVQGIFQQFMDGTDINAVDRSNSSYQKGMKLIASGDDQGKVRVLEYPCLVKNSQSVKGRGHSSHVTNVSFTVDDRYILSTGGEDQTIMQWKLTV